MGRITLDITTLASRKQGTFQVTIENEFEVIFSWSVVVTSPPTSVVSENNSLERKKEGENDKLLFHVCRNLWVNI